ncbi:hypothetical protein [uncultured Salinicola sp.]|uniref:hypothetical protein n=1 Tax=uncultured Salinicola sp. TaxID=1193542 RepID=UPI0026168804|nr:hypothetical protein [uncultured Salinicola sp.]|tara:strand:+ start:507 stop:728 length:222 start_codon:yes stop_codon:yes gene_type:complete
MAKNIHDIAADAMFMHEGVRRYPHSGDDLIVWPDGDSCNAEDLPGMGHKSDDYIRVPIDSDAYDIVAFEMKQR